MFCNVANTDVDDDGDDGDDDDEMPNICLHMIYRPCCFAARNELSRAVNINF